LELKNVDIVKECNMKQEKKGKDFIIKKQVLHPLHFSWEE